MRLIGCLLAACLLLSMSGEVTAITAWPGGPALLGSTAESYFEMRPALIDVAESPARTPSIGVCRALVILIDFSDKPADRTAHPPDTVATKLFGAQRSSLRSYFNEVSYRKFSLEGDVFGWFRSGCKHKLFVNRDAIRGTTDDYGLDISPAAVDTLLCPYPLNVWGVVKEAVEAAGAVVDFRQYDNDGPDGIPSSGDDDGFIDALFVVHSGAGAEIFGRNPGAENYIWSLESSLDYYAATRNTSVDGVRVGAFVLVPELSEIGVYAHEFCHLLGLPDLYDSVTGESIVGPFCLMDNGAWSGPQNNGSVPSHLSAPMKYFLGWIDPTMICLGCADGVPSREGARVVPVETADSAYVVLDNPDGMNWTAEGTGTGEYFMLEDRQRRLYDFYLPGSGMVIWKVDESRPDNNNPVTRLAEVIQADGETVTAAGQNVPGEPSDFWPGSLGKTAFTPYTFPASNLSGGAFSGVAVDSIEERPAGVVRANIRIGLPHRGKAYAYPNPSSREDLRTGPPLRIVFVPESGPAQPRAFEATVFDLEGRPVRRLEEGSEVLSEGAALWDGRDEDGRLVEPGLYLFHVKASGEEGTGVIAITD